MSAPGVVVPAVAGEAPLIDWCAIFAGAIVAAGIPFTLIAFGSAVGMSLVSTAPTWRDSSPWLWLLSGIYLVFVALCAFGFGGYTAGRMRSVLRPLTADVIEFRDGMHGDRGDALVASCARRCRTSRSASGRPTNWGRRWEPTSWSPAGEPPCARTRTRRFAMMTDEQRSKVPELKTAIAASTPTAGGAPQEVRVAALALNRDRGALQDGQELIREQVRVEL